MMRKTLTEEEHAKLLFLGAELAWGKYDIYGVCIVACSLDPNRSWLDDNEGIRAARFDSIEEAIAGIAAAKPHQWRVHGGNNPKDLFERFNFQILTTAPRA